MIQWGKQDMVFAGGCEELDWTLSVLFDAMGAMSTGYNQTPDKASRAYDRDRDGFVIAAAPAWSCWKSWSTRKRAGAKIYAELAGYGATSDGHDMVAPSGEGAMRCNAQALAGVTTPVDYINPHATLDHRSATSRRSRRSARCSAPRFRRSRRRNRSTGHSLGAAGVQEAIYSLLMMNNGFICESANIENIDPAFEDIPIVRERRDNVQLNTVLSNSFGFGGTNASVVFKRLDA
jgi:3-oxoacyl-[acyl-carrier-protein] synthase-1